jgi:hypothetical protein
MKARQLQFFLLEFTLSLVILSVALVVALTMFTVSARQHTQTLALRSISEIMVQEAEWLRHPDSDWTLRFPQSVTTLSYDLHGHPSQKTHYTLTLTQAVFETHETATLVLTEASTVLLTLTVVRALTP